MTSQELLVVLDDPAEPEDPEEDPPEEEVDEPDDEDEDVAGEDVVDGPAEESGVLVEEPDRESVR
ncbi:MAG: hypothetical protein R2734_17780 [Nocardioides sp.]